MSLAVFELELGTGNKMEEFLRVEDFDGLATFCENAELECRSDTPQVEVYSCLLAVYLLRNELDYAKLLWNRIPQPVKTGHSELASLWAIGQKLWNKQYSEVYSEAQGTTWPPHIAPIVSALVSSLQSRLLALVGKAYSVIKVDAVMELTGLTEDQLAQEASSRQWQIDSAKGTVTINRQESEPQDDANATEVLGRLTKAVSFLEC